MIEYYDDVDEEGVSYRCEVDVELYDDAPIEDFVSLLWIFVKVQNPEDEVYKSFQSDLIDTLHTSIGSIYAGSIIRDGWCELYFYATSSKSYTNITADVLKRHHPYPYECSASRDAKWEFYFDRLYPSAHAALKIQNRHTINALVEAGDDLSLSRDVEHYLFFQTKSALERALQTLQPYGFDFKEYVSDDESDYCYGAILVKNEAITVEQVEETTSVLFETSLLGHGHYEGWSTVLGK